ncbi:WASP homolog-associated protein with actin, membranes and microtubules isoform X2 [Sceloporus undulatus]|uniref:WASP homolog-associated protein with actin, membranes and microtubules isoform X2 n=1 Tax=Sceloporus undulatus TaxID=8520 RepID=UPI001C4CBC6E|nr:WASP homolog-associated protein with actin, membranes and microtubules isoform X2 [Sceloporus undulatus]
MEPEPEASQPDSLEGWVAVKAEAFSEPEPAHRLRFLVAWNRVEGMFAVTCHNRTLQEEQQQQDEEAEEEASSWAGFYSPRALQGAHRQLSALDPQLASAFPALPSALADDGGGAWGLWSLLFPVPEVSEAELEALCRRLERYLGWALELCGRKVLLELLFAQDLQEEERYFENLQEFRRKALKGRLAEAKEALRRILHQHKDTDKLVDLMELYKEEDEAYLELVTVATEFYQYLLQPFRDMRELATLYRLEILKSLQANRLGPKRVESLRKEAEEWTNQAEEAVCSIQDITVSYFKETVMALAAMQKQMEQDQKRFGQAAWASVSPRLENLKYLLAKETLQHMRAKELCLKHKRTNTQKQMETLEDQENDIDRVEELEIEYYETQLELYEVQFEILKNEELLLVAQLETLRRRMKEIQDEVIYYDTCETPDELEATEQALEETRMPSSEMAQLRQKTQQLETKRGIICSRRAYLRNKKDQCEESRRLRLHQAEESVRHFEQHHSIQIKRDKRKEDEKKKKAWIKQERQKTLERLKTFKEKCPAQFVLKTSRPQPLNAKQPQVVSRQTQAAPPQPLSTSKVPAAKQSRASRLARETKGSKALCQKPSKEISIQIFVPPHGLEQPKKSEAVSSLLPPPPPLPNIQPICLRMPQEASLPLKCEDSSTTRVSTKEGNSAVNNYTGSMDEVLASLKRGEIRLRKVEPSCQAASSGASLNDSILAAIRQGVKLRKVNQEPKMDLEKSSSNELERSIKAAIQRIKKVSADSEDDENNDHNSGEWNS